MHLVDVILFEEPLAFFFFGCDQGTLVCLTGLGLGETFGGIGLGVWDRFFSHFIRGHLIDDIGLRFCYFFGALGRFLLWFRLGLGSRAFSVLL